MESTLLRSLDLCRWSDLVSFSCSHSTTRRTAHYRQSRMNPRGLPRCYGCPLKIGGRAWFSPLQEWKIWHGHQSLHCWEHHQHLRQREGWRRQENLGQGAGLKRMCGRKHLGGSAWACVGRSDSLPVRPYLGSQAGGPVLKQNQARRQVAGG